MLLAEKVTNLAPSLSPAERRVADVVLTDPQVVAFGTVADLADAAGTSGATVIRLSGKLGFTGFSALQEAVQAELARRLRPAAERIREPVPPDLVGRSMERDIANVHDTLADLDRAKFDRAVRVLAEAPAVHVLAGEASRGVALQLVLELSQLRAAVRLLEGSSVRIARTLAVSEPGEVCVVIDLKRYERWVLDTVELAVTSGLAVVAITDSLIAPLAARAEVTFAVEAAGTGPFDSHVGILALLNALTAEVAGSLRDSATGRLDRIERSWRSRNELVDG